MSKNQREDQSYKPTPKKLEDAKKRGDGPRSQDLLIGASYLGLLISMLTIWPITRDQILSISYLFWNSLNIFTIDPTNTLALPLHEIYTSVLTIIVLIIFPSVAFLIIFILLQGGLRFIPSRAAPKLHRLSIPSNFISKFGAQNMINYFKSIFKMLVFLILALYFLTDELFELTRISEVRFHSSFYYIYNILTAFLIYIIIIYSIFSALDYIIQFFSFISRNRMTRQEVVDETKRSEGNPEVKMKRRQRAREVVMHQMLADVKDASVVIVNPTHYAVALRWTPTDPSPPMCVAKGIDNMALRIREVADHAHIPIFSDPITARALYASLNIGDVIEREHFLAVATAIRFSQQELHQ